MSAITNVRMFECSERFGTKKKETNSMGFQYSMFKMKEIKKWKSPQITVIVRPDAENILTSCKERLLGGGLNDGYYNCDDFGGICAACYGIGSS